MGESTSLVVFVDGPQGGKEWTGAIWPMEVQSVDGLYIESGEGGSQGGCDLL